MSDEELVKLIRSAPWSDGFPYLKETADRIEELEAKLKNMSMLWAKADAEKQASLGRIEELEAKLAKAVGVATLALDAVHEVQTYEQPDDPYTENALTMCELDAFDFDVEAARITIAELTGGNRE